MAMETPTTATPANIFEFRFGIKRAEVTGATGRCDVELGRVVLRIKILINLFI